MFIAPKLAEKNWLSYINSVPDPPTRSPQGAADSAKESQLIVKAVYVSSAVVITQHGITNGGERQGAGGKPLSAVSIERTAAAATAQRLNQKAKQ